MEPNQNQTGNYKKYMWMSGTLTLVCIAFAAFAMGLTDIKSWKHPTGQVASITVSGEGEVTALPDIATITVTIREEGKTVPEVQKLVEKKVSDALASIASLAIDKKDIKTLSYTVNPKYETQTIYCITVPCPQGKTKIVGYEASETIQIKVRKIEFAGDVLGMLGSANITEISGPDFTVDDIEKVKDEAKGKAIAEAKVRAKATAKSLGVSLGSIIQYSEDNGGYYPTMYSYGLGGAMKAESLDRVTIPQGENVIKSRVTITYSLD